MAKIGTVAQDVANYVAEFALTKLPRAAGPMVTSAMVSLIDRAIDGVGQFSSAKAVAARHLQRRGDSETAVEAVVRYHLALAAAQGTVTNIGGGLAILIGAPANITGLITVQIRMVACIAHLNGYDVDDRRVRTAVAMCLLGEQELERQIADRRLPSTPLAVATSSVHDPELHEAVADRILRQILTESAGKGFVSTIARGTPIIGGGVGGVADWLGTRSVSRCARAQLVSRRPVLTGGSYPQYDDPPVAQERSDPTMP